MLCCSKHSKAFFRNCILKLLAKTLGYGESVITKTREKGPVTRTMVKAMGNTALVIPRDSRRSMNFYVTVNVIDSFGQILLSSIAAKQEVDCGSQPMIQN